MDQEKHPREDFLDILFLPFTYSIVLIFNDLVWRNLLENSRRLKLGLWQVDDQFNIFPSHKLLKTTDQFQKQSLIYSTQWNKSDAWSHLISKPRWQRHIMHLSALFPLPTLLSRLPSWHSLLLSCPDSHVLCLQDCLTSKFLLLDELTECV